MTQQTKRSPWETCLAACLAMATFLLATVTVARAGGANDADKSLRPAAAPIRTTAAKEGKRRLADERAMANALRGRRDPFKVPPPPREGGRNDGLYGPLPPGSRGLVISRMKLKGIVREDTSKTMIAVVTNRSNLAYFLHVHDPVFNGVVTGITADSVQFAEDHLDSGGHVETQEVVLRLGSEPQEAR